MKFKLLTEHTLTTLADNSSVFRAQQHSPS